MRRAHLLIWLLTASLVPLGVAAEAAADDKKMPARKPRPPREQKAEPPPTKDMPPGPDANHEAGDEPKSLVEATATVWAQAGSRSWTGCSTVANEAGKQLWGYGEDVNNLREGHHWEIQARECPNAPEVLTMAARSELMRRFPLPQGLDANTELAEFEEETAQSHARAVEWIDDAGDELMRRRDKRSLGLAYWRGRALLATNELEGARQAFERSLALGTIEGWRIRRMLALTVLYQGKLDRALELAKRSVLDAPSGDRLVSQYVFALVLDRAGDPAGAARWMKASLDRDSDSNVMRSIEAAIPLHERLYMRAYMHTVRKDASAALRLWDVYLARPEPEAPERRLAERHRAALEPLPSNLGGMAKPGEAPP